jgi:hypothetical protein
VDNNVRCSLLRMKGTGVEYANAANADVLLMRAGEGVFAPLIPADRPDFRAPAFGRDQLEQEVQVLNFSLATGDTLIMHTEYLLTARNSKGEDYGIRRLMASLRRADMESSQSLLSSIMIDFRNFMAGSKRQDDTTVVVLRKL